MNRCFCEHKQSKPGKTRLSFSFRWCEPVANIKSQDKDLGGGQTLLL